MKILANNTCISKKPPFYEYPKGWIIDTKKFDKDLNGYVRIHTGWYRTYTEAKNDYLNQYNIAKEAALSRKNSKPHANGNLPFGKFLELFSAYRLTKVRGSTFYHLDKFVQSNFLASYAELPIKEVFCRDFAIRFKEEVLRKNLTKAYKNKALGYYRQMCDYAFGSGMLPPDQYAYCKFATEQISREEETPIVEEKNFVLTDDEITKLLLAIDDPIHKMLTEFLFATGFRLSEALALTPKEIDFNKRTITREYVWQVDEYGTEKRLHRTKSGFGGTFPASETILASLLGYIRTNHIQDDESLFPCATDLHRPVEQQWYRKKLKAYCKKAGIREIHPHIARHTFCTKVAALTGNSNADKRSLEILTGHTMAVNQNIYTHADEEVMRQIVDTIGNKA